jgi:hypothetical protein
LKFDEQILTLEKEIIDKDEWENYLIKDGDVLKILKTDPKSRLRFVNAPLYVRGEDIVIKAALENLVPMHKYATVLS